MKIKHEALNCPKTPFYFGAMICVVLTFWGSLVTAAPKDSPWGEGYFPNVELLDQEGNKVRFYDDIIKGKVVAVNFIYTNCGDSCPAETASLKQVKKLLGDRVGKDIFFYSISVDPEHDTPQVLREYADRFNVGTGWQFLTGSKEDVILIRKKFGLYREETEQGKPSQHNINFIIGNENTGQWMKKTPFDEPKSLAWLLGYTLPEKKIKPGDDHVSYREAHQTTKLSKAEEIFRFRCASCHSLGSENGLGPGLHGITKRRERPWLTRWLKEPDLMLKEEDPIAMELFKRYNKVLMPNLRLSETDVEALIQFLEASDGKAENTD